MSTHPTSGPQHSDGDRQNENSSTIPTVDLHIGRDELIIRGRYETLSIANDVLIGVIFLIGSFLFFSDKTVFQGTVLFVIGSVLMMIRPTIRLVRRVHLTRRFPRHATETSRDF